MRSVFVVANQFGTPAVTLLPLPAFDTPFSLMLIFWLPSEESLADYAGIYPDSRQIRLLASRQNLNPT